MNTNPENKSYNSDYIFDRAAKNDFESALRKGFWRSVISWFTRADNNLLPFDEIRRNLPLGGQHEIGNQQVLLEKIVGSIGRYQDFDRVFLPRRTHTRGRWESIDKAHLQDISLPPIELYKIGSVFFVKDGNHRVSVARERGQAYIDAYVTEIDVPFEIDEESNIDEVIRKSEAIQFEEKTHIAKIRPDNGIEFSLPGGASKVLEHIDVHRYYMGENRKAEVSYEEAVENWYDEVYWPLAAVIRQYHLLREFPERTVADLYLWIIEHLYFLKEKYQAEVSLEQAAAHFTDEYAKKPFSWLIHFFRQILGGEENEESLG
jgi:hypothetical protein